MTHEEQIAALKEEIVKLKGDLETERKKSTELVANLSQEKDAVKQLEQEVEDLKETIEELASAEAMPSESKAAISGLEFKHKDQLYSLDEHPDRQLIIPAIGQIKASDAVSHPAAIAYLVEKEIATKL